MNTEAPTWSLNTEGSFRPRDLVGGCQLRRIGSSHTSTSGLDPVAAGSVGLQVRQVATADSTALIAIDPRDAAMTVRWRIRSA